MRPRFRGDSLRHLLPILAACQILGIVAADRGWVAPDAALVAGATAVAMGGLLARSARARSSFAALAAAAAGALALGNQLGEAARGWPLEPRELAIVGTVRNATAGVHWMRVDLVDVVAADRHAAPPASRVRVIGRRSAPNTPALESALPGERRRLSVRLRAPAPRRNPGSVGWRDRLVRAGVGAEASLTHPALHVRLPEREGRRPLAALHAARIKLGEALSARGPGGSLLRALALGDRRGLSSETRDDFASLGLAHLLAVSGLHLTLMASLSFAGVRMTLGRRAWLAARWDTRIPALVVGVACAAGYALLAGWGIPVRRALVLLLGLVVAVARARPGGRAPPLAAAAMAILWIQPEALFEPGAQLSFAASAALAAAVDPMPSSRRRGAHRRWLGVFSTALRASATAVAATAPLVAYHMAKVAPLGLVANAFAVPWTALALLPAAMLGTLAAAFPSIGTEFVSMACEHVGRVSLSAVEWAAARATGFETDARPAIPWCLGAAGIAIWVLRVRTTRMRVGLALAQSVLLSFAPAPQIRPPPPRVVVFHVGQGDAILVQGRRAAVLIDAGTRIPGGVDRGHQTVIPGLAALGVRRLDLMIATHADLDHRGGLPEVLRAYPVGELWLPESGRDDAGFQELLAAAREREVPVLERGSASPPSRFGDVLVTPLWPPRGDGNLRRNDRSLVVAFDVGGRRVLIPGDLEAFGEAALLRTLLPGGVDLGADVLALPHHGSRTSSSRAFLRAVRPRVAVASAPCRGRFGMPHREVLDRTRELGIPVWWTGRDGAVLIGLGDPLVAWGYSDLESSNDFRHICRFPGNQSNR